ncbi:hypothetical protein SCG_01956, partial [Enterococcus faecalis EnGen0102]
TDMKERSIRFKVIVNEEAIQSDR